MRSPLAMLAVLSILAAAPAALGHKPSDSYLKVFGGGERLRIQWDIALKDLQFVLGLDADSNGEITWGEVKARSNDISGLALSRLSLSSEGSPCGLRLERLLATRHSDGGYASLMLDTDCPGDAREVELRYALLFDVDPTHRGLVLYRSGGGTSSHVLSVDHPTATLRKGEAGLAHSLASFVREGVWHIWIGYDHVLFLVALLFPAVLRRDDTGWAPVESFRPTLASVAKVVTSFTLAHSITLWLAVMEYVSLPSQWVEACIALSIVVTAVDNLVPVLPMPAHGVAFAFGLVHGFGFASVLQDLGLDSTSLAVSLLGFNLGVELGQMAIVAAFLPVAYLLRSSSFYRRCVLQAGSVAVGVLGAIWTMERVCNVTVLRFPV